MHRAVPVTSTALDGPAVGVAHGRPLVQTCHHVEVSNIDILAAADRLARHQTGDGADERVGA